MEKLVKGKSIHTMKLNALYETLVNNDIHVAFKIEKQIVENVSKQNY
jgi:hypothetical protein